MSDNMSVQNIGIGLTIIGFIVLIGYVFYETLASDASLILKLSIAAIILGVTVLLLSLIREKMTVKDDEVERKY